MTPPNVSISATKPAKIFPGNDIRTVSLTDQVVDADAVVVIPACDVIGRYNTSVKEPSVFEKVKMKRIFVLGFSGLLLSTVNLGHVQSAHAEALKPRVWIAPIQAREGVAGAGLLAEKFDEVARGQLQRSQKIETADKAGMGPVKAGESDPRIEKAERLRVASKQDYASGNKKRAFKQLKAALELYEAGLASIAKLEVVLETLGYLGASAFDLGYEGDARDYFRRVVTMAPDAEPLDEYSEPSKAFFAKTRKKLLKKKRGNIYVQSVPKGAVVRLNGVEKGKTPLRLKKLVRGLHCVQLSHPTAGLSASVIKVKSKKTTRTKLTLSQDVGPKQPGKASEGDVAILLKSVADNRLDRGFREKAREIGELTQARYVVVGVIDAEGNGFVLNAFVYGVREKQVIALDRFKFKADIASTMIKAAQFAKEVEKTAITFPQDKVLAGKVFVVRAEPPKAPAVPAAKPAPAPVPVPVVTPKVPAQPAPKVVTPTRPTVEPKPARPVVKPEPAITPPSKKSPLTEPVVSPVPNLIQETPLPATSYTSRPKWYRSWWFWTVTGSVVTVGSIGGYFLLKEDEPSGRFEVDVRWR